ncbi:polysaccharide deacetylase family protein [Pyramidobacter piscolens]|uniref:polysaccharide deacetylase family protein n=1 Tax=Pyramidobacter piscolens TaxID=638849 RepID=UPI001FCCB538|nr:polysaccharide deacetylase [Pyramidobacter piscolens]BDF77841.1 polysaccharide deacetylase [Pyramidobacter piscolens]
MPEIEWKDGARCAALITVNLDAENFWLAVDPDVSKRPKTLSMGQYGMDRGLPRLLELLDDLDIKATFFVPGSTAAAYAEKVKDVAARGHEIALRGYELLNWGLLPAEQAAADMEKGAAVLKNVVGAQPRGYRAPIAEFTLDTLRAAHANGAVYSSSLSSDDRPFWFDLGNGEKLLEIPVHWALYDLPYFAFNYHPPMPKGQGRIANSAQVFNNFREEFLGCAERGLCYVLQLDPQTACTPGRMPLLRGLLTEIKESGAAWLATGGEMYDYWSAVYPAK